MTDPIAAAWTADRRYLEAVASRILADAAEAEDVVQDAFARLSVQRVDEIDDVRAWLVVVVRRLALDRLGSAHRRLSSPAEEVPGDPVPDPADRVTLDEDVRRAFGVVLDRLTPAERTSFLLHDVFGFPFDGVAEIVGRSPAACRQLASRARRAIRDGASARPVPVDPRVLAVAERFAAACAGGDLEALVRELDPDVSGWATVDGRRTGFAEGAATVGPRILWFLGPRSGCELVPVPLESGVAVLASRRAEPVVVLRLDVELGEDAARDRVVSMHALVLPA
ncbi:sigma-70 family RNA polymerase sigma factor [Nocardioides sp. T2.26MG-1]|uniref:sigma-70 family RNA polymerase sigma factor n=1 Tax=Nocardioides sp. T2.26MG-1 TaxID=3041166 RepID=UPI00247763D0|nr:sigma-70 family RNA polymerase sigma factor [Nocardioides sp. T2.26MG-1]CAI9412136.1 putative ECF RNA polymerase sigma factor SigI [Nocardioides sp. T2.26MG-1]